MKATILHTLRNLHTDESGQDLIEYALIAALMATASIAALGILSEGISAKFTAIVTKLTAA